MLDLLIIGIRGRIKQKNTVYLYKCGYEYRPTVDYGIHSCKKLYLHFSKRNLEISEKVFRSIFLIKVCKICPRADLLKGLERMMPMFASVD